VGFLLSNLGNSLASTSELEAAEPLFVCCILLYMARRLAVLLLLLAAAQAPATLFGQAASGGPDSPRPSSPPLQQTQPKRTLSEASPDPVPAQQPQIVVNSAPTQPAPWTWHDKVLWGANLILVVLGYTGVMLALRTLKGIQRQTEFGVAAAQAALQCANAALESSQAIVDSGRPWIVISVEPFMTQENGFKVMATNRGRTPARITAKSDCAKIAADETKLPEMPNYGSGKSTTPFEPIILLPGESAGIRPFRRSDVRPLCASDEEFKRVEKWEEKLFIYGRVAYRDLISPLDQPDHETAWCCWYAYGEKDALVIAGPPLYNKHI
jgi:hypothetical protein